MPASRVRRLEAGDAAAIVRLAADFHNASAYRHLSLALDKIDRLFVDCMTRDDHLCVVAADAASNRAEGYLAVICHEHYFSYEKTISDVGFYISEDYRSMQIVRQMLQVMESWAFNTMRVPDISLGISSGIADKLIVRLYERMGYSRGYYGVIKSR
jgi:hypothetical protein